MREGGLLTARGAMFFKTRSWGKDDGVTLCWGCAAMWVAAHKVHLIDRGASDLPCEGCGRVGSRTRSFAKQGANRTE